LELDLNRSTVIINKNGIKTKRLSGKKILIAEMLKWEMKYGNNFIEESKSANNGI
jgi:hypothetical protein